MIKSIVNSYEQCGQHEIAAFCCNTGSKCLALCVHAQKWTTWSMLSTICCNVVLHPVNNVVLHSLNNCCKQPLFTVVHGQQSLLTTINKLVLSTIVSSCSNKIVTIIVFCQHRTTIDRTILINIVNSTSVVEPWQQHCLGVVQRTMLHQPDEFLRAYRQNVRFQEGMQWSLTKIGEGGIKTIRYNKTIDIFLKNGLYTVSLKPPFSNHSG